MTVLAFSHSSRRGGLELLAAVEVTHTHKGQAMTKNGCLSATANNPAETM
jgi:hypothetical protein